MLIGVDQTKCQTAGICVKECPEVFSFQQGSKKATIVPNVIPDNLFPKCREIVEKCPTGVIEIYDR